MKCGLPEGTGTTSTLCDVRDDPPAARRGTCLPAAAWSQRDSRADGLAAGSARARS
jgi:hypothetical protein